MTSNVTALRALLTAGEQALIRGEALLMPDEKDRHRDENLATAGEDVLTGHADVLTPGEVLVIAVESILIERGRAPIAVTGGAAGDDDRATDGGETPSSPSLERNANEKRAKTHARARA
jgi:hypothetical protein